MSRILFIGTLPDPLTGQSVACQALYDAMATDHTVDVVNLSKPELRNGVSSLARIGQILRIVGAVWKRQRRADRIYFTISESVAGNLKDLLVYLVCWRKLKMMLVHLHGGANLRHLMRGRLRAVNAVFLRRVGGAVILGPRHRSVFHGVIPSHRIHLVPNFAHPDLLIDEAALDAKFATPSPLRLLFLSNLIPGKGYREVLEAMLAMDEQQRAAVHLDFAGAFEAEADKRAFLAHLATLPTVRYHGVVRGERKRSLFQRAHVFVLPTYYAYEGTPISILEAYAAGCAVITTDHSGIGDIFTDGIHGTQVTPQSPVAVKNAILRAMSDPARLLRMARHNRQEAVNCYQMARHTTALMTLINELDCSHPGVRH